MDTNRPGTLQKTIAPAQFLVFGFGSIVGTGWVVLLGAWLAKAGPGGAAVGLAAGGAAMALIAAFYAELAFRLPQTGGEVTYINAVFGKTAGFVVGWLLTLAYLSVLVFEGVALGWLLDMLWPAIEGPTLYVAFGHAIGLGNLAVAVVACLTIAVLNHRGARSFVRFQNALTIVFLLIVAVAVGCELAFGSAANLVPAWQGGESGSWLVGAAWVFASAPFVLNSFQTVLHAIEERSAATSKAFVVRACVVTVVGASLFYVLVVLAAGTAAPWRSLAANDLPAVAALARLPGARALTVAFLVALIASVLKTWNSVFMTTARLLYAQARDGMIPAFFGSVDPKTGAPDKAVVVIAAFNLAGLFVGRGVLDPIVDTTSVCIGLIYALVCAAALQLRRRGPAVAGFRVPGGTPVAILAIALALTMALFAFVQPAKTEDASAFKWIVLGAWAVVGLGLYRLRNRGVAAVDRGVVEAGS